MNDQYVQKIQRHLIFYILYNVDHRLFVTLHRIYGSQYCFVISINILRHTDYNTGEPSPVINGDLERNYGILVKKNLKKCYNFEIGRAHV